MVTNIIAVPVSGLVSKCVLDFEICRHKLNNLDASVDVKLLFLGNKVPLTCDNSKSAIKGSKRNSALKPTGLHHGRTMPKKNMAFHIQHQVR